MTSIAPMEWYWARCLYVAVHKYSRSNLELLEKTVFLIQATGMSDATEKAQTIALSRETDYMTSAGDVLQWKLISVEEIQKLWIGSDDITHGTEVYWEFRRRRRRIDPGHSESRCEAT